MTEIAKTLSKRARALPPPERLVLVDDILGSLDETNPRHQLAVGHRGRRSPCRLAPRRNLRDPAGQCAA